MTESTNHHPITGSTQHNTKQYTTALYKNDFNSRPKNNSPITNIHVLSIRYVDPSAWDQTLSINIYNPSPGRHSFLIQKREKENTTAQ
ncbi:hypothetical protein EYC80_003195 [Monilinia laxa]|uniref:Uncharacterized protein n=1 Tax=Monilinia laxa TaxID=61186 RepID=A0A5N6KD74_MONLA|nr:hypothetical protein EYC80_003195 [Monilinia laxa]